MLSRLPRFVVFLVLLASILPLPLRVGATPARIVCESLASEYLAKIGELIVPGDGTFRASRDESGAFVLRSVSESNAVPCVLPAEFPIRTLRMLRGALVVDGISGRGLDIEAAGSITIVGPLALDGPFSVSASDLRVQTTIVATGVHLRANGPVTLEPGSRIESRVGENGGVVTLAGTIVWQQGVVDAGGEAGGAITITAEKLALTGALIVDGRSGSGGNIAIEVAKRLVGMRDSQLSATGSEGGMVQIRSEFLFTSGEVLADGLSGDGGQLTLLGDEIRVVGATLSATGEQGGKIRVGSVRESREVEVTASSRLVASGRSGPGGLVDVSASERVISDGEVEVGTGGQLIIDPAELVIDEATGEFPWYSLVKPTPKVSGDNFGRFVVPLPSGNVAVTAPSDDFAATNAGAIYLYDGLTGSLLTMMTGGSANDRISDITGGGSNPITILPNGNFVVQSIFWTGSIGPFVGAVTWFSGVSGANGVVTATTSLVGSVAFDGIGVGGIVPLPNSNYLILSPGWRRLATENVGAVTWANGATGITGTISANNSLVGLSEDDFVGNSGSVTILTDGNAVLASPDWNNGPISNVGAVTWLNASTGLTGEISVTNSLVGLSALDAAGRGGITPLPGGNYVVSTPDWDGPGASNAGAVTLVRAPGQRTGVISGTNSLVGGTADNAVSNGGIVVLSNGNYVVLSPAWDNELAADVGAVTWVHATTGLTGVVTVTNSLVGSTGSDAVGVGGVTALPNGNYVVGSALWNGPTAPQAGAVTWGSGSTGITGIVTVTNSLVGSTPLDRVGLGGIVVVTQSNYVVQSSNWNAPGATKAGAVTWGSGSSGITGVVSVTNSLVGGTADDQVGNTNFAIGVRVLANGNYVVQSQQWDGPGSPNAGAVTWGNGSTGITGVVSITNSLVGQSPDDQVGWRGVFGLPNGNFVVLSPIWDGPTGDSGAATWVNGTTGLTGFVTTTNSLIGDKLGDQVGLNGILVLANGNYVVGSRLWSGTGAATWVNGATGLVGVVSETNSLVGPSPGADIGASLSGLPNGNYLVRSPLLDAPGTFNSGAITWGNGTGGTVGVVSTTNSLMGSFSNDRVGDGEPIVLPNSDYLVATSSWLNNTGAVTWGSGQTGVSGIITRSNSVIGRQSSSGLFGVIPDPVNGSFVAAFLNEGGGRVAVGLPDPAQLRFPRGAASRIVIVPRHLTQVLNKGTAVTVEASRDITVTSPITALNPIGAGGALTIAAGRTVALGGLIRTDDGPLTAIANDRLSTGVVDAHRPPGPGDLTLLPGAAIDAGTGAVTLDLRDGAGKTNTTPGVLTTGPITASAITLRSAGGLALNGPLVATGGVSLTATGGVTLTAPATISGGPLSLGSELRLNGQTLTVPAGLVLGPGGTLAGSGTVVGPVNVGPGAALSPGSSPGTVFVVGSLSVTGQTRIELNGPVLSQWDQVVVTGTVAVGGPLAVTLGFSPALGSEFVIIANDGIDPVGGSFTGLPEGTTLSAGGQPFLISYRGGDGNDVSLLAASPPLAVTNAATGISATGATFNGRVQAQGATTSVRFEWGTIRGSYPFSVTASPSVVTGTVSTDVSAVLSGLSPNTTYVFRLRAENGVGVTYGAERCFNTLPAVNTAACANSMFLPVIVVTSAQGW